MTTRAGISPGECGWPIGSPLYWVSFQVVTAFLLLNVIVAVVLQIFEVRFVCKRQGQTLKTVLFPFRSRSLCRPDF
jgi:hypothetical protein